MRRSGWPLAIIIIFLSVALAALFQNCAGGYTLNENYRNPASETSNESNPNPSQKPSPTPSGPQKNPTGGLPYANHPMDFGYYFADGRYGDFRSEVDCYTNLLVAWARRGYEPDASAPNSTWLPLMEKSMKDAFIAKKNIYLSLNLQEEAAQRVTPVDDVLQISQGVWSQVSQIELADEPSWNKDETERRLQDLRTRIHNLGLTPKPLGVVYTNTQVLSSDAIFAEGLDWVGVEAYIDPPGSGDAQTDVNNLTSYLQSAFDRIPQGKKIVVVLMAYARNGGWTNMETLKAVQTPAYKLAANNPRVIAITAFSYGRGSGTREHPELKPFHVQIGNAALKRTCPY